MRTVSVMLAALFFANIVPSAAATDRADYSETLEALLDDDDLSLTDVKLTIDGLVQPDMDREGVKTAISTMARQALMLAGADASADQKVIALKTLIYKPGPWNDERPFGYDFDDPQGRVATSKTLASYIDLRKGNCVTMPMLFLAVADEMGVALNITTAPQHLFIQFENPRTGEVQHLETTSGADPQRLSWQRKILPMTDRAVETGMYMKRLDRREMIVVIAETLLQDLDERDDQAERFEVAQIIVREYPQSDVGLLHLSNAAKRLIQREVVSKYPDPREIPDDVMAVFDRWARADYGAEQALRYYGWKPKGEIDNSKYDGVQ